MPPFGEWMLFIVYHETYPLLSSLAFTQAESPKAYAVLKAGIRVSSCWSSEYYFQRTQVPSHFGMSSQDVILPRGEP